VTIMFVRPADDNAAIYASACGHQLRQLATSCGTTDLSGAQVTRARLDQDMGNHKHLFWFGHGKEDALIAFGSAMVDDQNLPSLKGGLVIAVACYSAVTLGQIAKSGSGVAAFLGFDDKFVFPTNGEVTMSLYLRRGLSCILIHGHGIGCAASELKQAFKDLRDEYRRQERAGQLSGSDALFGRTCAANHFLSLQLIGDMTTTL
jgi:hypothetical protein